MTPTAIREARKQLGLSQSDLARLLGLSSQTRIAEYEAGTRRPSRSAQLLLAAYAEGRLPLDWPEVVRGEEVPPTPQADDVTTRTRS